MKAALLTEAYVEGASLTQFYVTDLMVVKLRVRVVVDFYPQQSLATVEVLSPDQAWTELITLPPALWHDGPKTDLKLVSDDLLSRAMLILENPARPKSYDKGLTGRLC